MVPAYLGCVRNSQHVAVWPQGSQTLEIPVTTPLSRVAIASQPSGRRYSRCGDARSPGIMGRGRRSEELGDLRRQLAVSRGMRRAPIDGTKPALRVTWVTL